MVFDRHYYTTWLPDDTTVVSVVVVDVTTSMDCRSIHPVMDLDGMFLLLLDDDGDDDDDDDIHNHSFVIVSLRSAGIAVEYNTQ